MSNVKAFVKGHPVAAYFVMTYAISWGGSIAVLGLKFFHGAPFQMTDRVLALSAMLLGPVLSGLILTSAVDGRTGFQSLFSRMRRWRVGCRWYLTAVLTFPLLILAVLITLSSVVSREFTPSFMTLGIIYGLLAGFIEEIGWMGYAYPKMRLKYSILAASLILGFSHGVWHIVADFLGSSQNLGGYWMPHFFLMWCFAMVALRVVIVWIYENTQSVLLAQITHASSTGFLIVLSPSPVTPAGETVWYGVYGVVIWTLAAIIIAKNKEHFLHPSKKRGTA